MDMYDIHKYTHMYECKHIYTRIKSHMYKKEKEIKKADILSAKLWSSRTEEDKHNLRR